MTAHISLIPEETRGHRPRLQLRDFDCMCEATDHLVFCNSNVVVGSPSVVVGGKKVLADVLQMGVVSLNMDAADSELAIGVRDMTAGSSNAVVGGKKV